MKTTILKRIKFFFYFLVQRRDDLIILDDAFPHLLSGFRIAEFNSYLKKVKKCRVYCTGYAFRWLNENRGFEAVKRDYEVRYPQHSSKVHLYRAQPLKAKLAYFVFITNTYNFLEQVNKYSIPFVFTLYPGGGFQLNNPEVDEKLKTIFSSTYFRHVIVTTKTTYEYILSKGFCTPNQVTFIYGVVLPTSLYLEAPVKKKKYTTDKPYLDICFVAHKYTDRGVDKGYDTFIAVAKKVLQSVNDIRFHVVGNFNESDIDVSAIRENITFYNTLTTNEFPSFYSGMDIILSPNKSFVLHPGAFDGFPTGACIEAGLNAVAIFATDDLKQNIYFEHKRDLVFINTDAEEIASQILYYHSNADELYALAHKGKEMIKSKYDIDVQMEPRLQIIEQYIS